MTFAQHILGTLLAVVAGFLFSLCLFWIKEYISSKRREKHLKCSVRYEFDYNIHLFEQFVEDLTKCLEKISLDEKAVYSKVDYEHFAYFFFREFYRQGLASKLFHYEDIRRWSEIVANSALGAETYLQESLKDWRDSKIDKQKISKRVNFERDQLQYSIDMLKYLKARIQ